MQPPDIRISFQARNTAVVIRTITPEDGKIEADFVRNLSPESRYLRFHSGFRELTPELLNRFTRITVAMSAMVSGSACGSCLRTGE